MNIKKSIKQLVPGDTVWVVHDDGYCIGSGVSGFMFLSLVCGYVIACPFEEDVDTASGMLQYLSDETNEEGYTEVVIFPKKVCFSTREDAYAVLDLEDDM